MGAGFPAGNQVTELLSEMMVISRAAGSAILEIYADDDLGIKTKDDSSPLTRADLAAHEIIVKGLGELAPEIPVLSEESEHISYEARRNWQRYFLVDPLDGTKEFINRNGEFTVNIALIVNGIPVMGVVFVPVKDVLYAGTQIEEKRAFVEKGGEQTQIQTRNLGGQLEQNQSLTIVASRRHGGEELTRFVGRLENHFPHITTTNMGSSLKLCLVAEGEADLYPRLAPTSEWDTAAAQAVVEAAGGLVVNPRLEPLRYNTKDDLLNPHFFVLGDPGFNWLDILGESD